MASLRQTKEKKRPTSNTKRTRNNWIVESRKRLTVFSFFFRYSRVSGTFFGLVASAVMDKQLLTRLIKKHDEKLLFWRMKKSKRRGPYNDGHGQTDDATDTFSKNRRQQRNTIRTQLAHHKCHIVLLLLHNRRARITAETRTGQEKEGRTFEETRRRRKKIERRLAI